MEFMSELAASELKETTSKSDVSFDTDTQKKFDSLMEDDKLNKQDAEDGTSLSNSEISDKYNNLFEQDDLSKTESDSIMESASDNIEESGDLSESNEAKSDATEISDSTDTATDSTEKTSADDAAKSEASETKSEGLTEEEKAKIKEETGWSDEIIDNIKNMKQYEILKNANLIEVEINGRKCLIRTDIDLDKKWPTGRVDENGNPIYKTNRERMAEGKPPLDENGKPIQLHHLGQKADSPLVELTEEEHRTGEYENGKKNQSLWHDNAKETEVHGAHENEWKQERENHWKARSEQTNGGD